VKHWSQPRSVSPSANDVPETCAYPDLTRIPPRLCSRSQLGKAATPSLAPPGWAATPLNHCSSRRDENHEIGRPGPQKKESALFCGWLLDMGFHLLAIAAARGFLQVFQVSAPLLWPLDLWLPSARHLPEACAAFYGALASHAACLRDLDPPPPRGQRGRRHGRAHLPRAPQRLLLSPSSSLAAGCSVLGCSFICLEVGIGSRCIIVGLLFRRDVRQPLSCGQIICASIYLWPASHNGDSSRISNCFMEIIFLENK
jgi:hypothetical protein